MPSISKAVQLRIDTLENEILLLQRDYESISKQYLDAIDVASKNSYERQMNEILKKIDATEKILFDLKSEHSQSSNTLETVEAESQLENNDFLYWGGKIAASVDVNEGVGYENLQEKLDEVKVTLSTVTQRESELIYLNKIESVYRHWKDLYTDVSASVQKILAKSDIAESYVEKQLRYIEMEHAIFKDIDHDSTADFSKPKHLGNFNELYNEVVRFKRIALLGDPGAGKTTTLERLTYHLAEKAIASENEPLPLFVRMGGYKGGDFDEFLQGSFGGLDVKLYLPNKIFLLMDGINEMPPEFIVNIQDWLEKNKQIPVLVTCRKLDYVGYKLQLQRIDVLPLDVGRIYQFIGNFLKDIDREKLFWGLAGSEAHDCWTWYQKQGGDISFQNFWYGLTDKANLWDKEKRQLKQIQDNLRKEEKLPGLLGMVGNPFLLFAVIQIYMLRGTYPANKGQLFDLFVTLLMEKRGKPAASIRGSWIEEQIQRHALAKLAYAILNEKTGTSVDEYWAIKIITEAIEGINADQLLYLAASAGIISRSRGSIRFVHQLLQEYFAAYMMGEDLRLGIPATKYWPSEKWWEQTGWEETAVILAGMEAESTNVVNWLALVNPGLAFRCVKESGNKCSEDAINNLYNPPKGQRFSPAARAEWGRIQGYSGDARPGVGVVRGLPDILWCRVPSGEFFMGGDPEVAIAHSRWDGARINIEYDYWLSKHLITYAQYELFVNDDGYTNDSYWTKTGLEWRGEQTKPRYWKDPYWHISNHPVVGITWYEAYAFTQWLNNKLSLKDILGEDITIRLPTESEWEKAARFPDERKYPWGDSYSAGFANVDETNEMNPAGPNYMRRTTAVGIYLEGESSLGIHDLSGNTWEWIQSKHSDPYIFPEDNNPEGDSLRVLRGGSWFYDQDFIRCASRARDHAGNRDYDLGFRVCAVPNNLTEVKLKIVGTKNKVFGETPKDI